MNWFEYFFKSSIGRKQTMALTGIMMSGFLITHLSGNLLLFADADGVKFNAYAAFLESQIWLIPAEIGLVVIFLVHVYLAISLTLENRRARGGQGYAGKKASDATLAARSMIYSGVLVFVFLIIHLLDFKFAERGPGGLAEVVVVKLSQPLYGGFYLACMVLLTFHLAHGLHSAFQSFGLNHRAFTPRIKMLCLILAIGLCVGFSTIPLWLMMSR